MLLSGIVMLGSGLCTIVLSVSDPKSTGIFLIYGVIPFLVAGGAYWLGNWMRRTGKRPGGQPGPDDPPPAA